MSEKNQWWQAPEEGEEYHTPRVWGEIEAAARQAGDTKRADEAREAGDRESRSVA